MPWPDSPIAAAPPTLPTWLGGIPAALDPAIASPHWQDTSAEASTPADAAAEAYERCKWEFLNTEADCRAQAVAFVPIVAEPSGGSGSLAMCTFEHRARAAAIRSDSDYAPVFVSLVASMRSVIRQSNAQALLRRQPEGANRCAELSISAIAGVSLDADA